MTTRPEKAVDLNSLPETKALALASGATYFFTGVPCRAGHISKRRTKTGMCCACDSARQLRYAARHPQKVRRALYDYREKNSEKIREISRKSGRKNSAAKVLKNKLWRLKNPEKLRAISKRQYHKNPAYYLHYAAARRVALERASYSPSERSAIVDFYARCPDGWHVDHIIPIKHPRVCGLHTLANLQYLRREENLRKHNKFEEDDC